MRRAASEEDAIPSPAHAKWAQAQLKEHSKVKDRPQNPHLDRINTLVSLFQRGQYRSVVEEINQDLPSYPVSFQLLNILGMAHQQLGNSGEAIDAFQKVAALLPGNTAPLNSIGVILQEQGKLEIAVRCFEKAISADPRNAGAYYNLGNALRDQGDLDQALSAYRTSASISPSNASVYNNMGNLLQDLDQFDEAVDSYDRAISIRSDYIDAHYNMARALKHQGKPEGAILVSRRVIALAPEHAEAKIALANTLKETGQWDEAIQLYSQVTFSERSNLNQETRLDALKNLLILPVGSLEAEIVGKIEALLEKSHHISSATSRYLFMRAKMLAHKGKITEAAKFLKKANAAKRTEIVALGRKLDGWKDYWDTSELMSHTTHVNGTTPLSILLILGPSRSGKSSLEQLLAADEAVLPRYEAVNFALLRKFPLDELRALSPDEKTRIAREAFYLTRENDQQVLNSLIICTHPSLITVLPALHALLGRLNIVWMDRNDPGHIADLFALDYMRGNQFSYDISSIKEHLTAYAERMMQFSNAFPDQLLRVRYQDFLANPRAEIDRIEALVGRKLAANGSFSPSAARRHIAHCEALAHHLL